MQLDPNLEKTVFDAIDRVATLWARAAALPIGIDLKNLEVVERDPFLRSLGASVCVGRSPFVNEGTGIGGWILPESAADRLARGALQLPPPPSHVLASFGGPIDEGIQLLHALFIEAWNLDAPIHLRLNDDISARRAERLYGLGNRVVESPMYPWVVAAGVEIGGQFFQIGFLISPKFCVVPHPDYAVPTRIVSWSDEGRSPVAFVDPTGTVTRWLMEEIRAGRLTCTRGAPVDAAAAIVTVGGRPGVAPVETLTISTTVTETP